MSEEGSYHERGLSRVEEPLGWGSSLGEVVLYTSPVVSGI